MSLFRFLRERERNVLFNDALNTFYLRLYGVRHMVKDHSDSEKGNPVSSHRLLLSINNKVVFYMHHPTEQTYHGLCYTSRGALAGTKNSSMGPPHEGSISVCILLFGFVFKHDAVAQCERIWKDGAGVRRNSCPTAQWSKHPF